MEKETQNDTYVSFTQQMQVGKRNFQWVKQKFKAPLVYHPRFQLFFIEAIPPPDFNLVVQDGTTPPPRHVKQIAHLLLGQVSLKQIHFDQLRSTQYLKNIVIKEIIFANLAGPTYSISIFGVSKSTLRHF